jgi:tetratricopeptide (TPR) repeat protein
VKKVRLTAPSVFLGVLLVVVSDFSQSQKLPDSLLHSLVSKGIDLTLRQKYSEAESLFQAVARTFPEHPAGYLYQAAVLQTRALDFVVPLRRETFDSLLEKGETLSERMIDSMSSSPWGHYFLATTYGYDAYARVERGDWFGGFRKGLSAASEFKICVERDSAFYDAFAGLGTYYYWKSRKTEFLHWLPFISDDRPEGIRLLRFCADHGTYNRFVALSALVTIFLDAGHYHQSVSVAKEALAAYPQNRVFLWGLAEALSQLGRHKEALAAYNEILKSVIADSIPNPYSEVLCRLNIVRMKNRLADTTDVEMHLNALLAYEKYGFSEDLQDRALEKFKEARRIKENLRNSKPAGN